MKLLNKYFKVVQEIYEYFDYVGGKQIYPIEDYCDFFWMKTDNTIYYSENKDSGSSFDEYLEEYIGEEYTMFLIKDTHNLDDCLIIFENKKEIYLEYDK